MLSAASIFVHTKDSTDPEIRTVRPPVYAESIASISVLVSSLGLCALALQKWPLLELENALLLSLKCLNNQRMVHPPYLNQPHEGISKVISSNG
jgi:hypothetical protein